MCWNGKKESAVRPCLDRLCDTGSTECVNWVESVSVCVCACVSECVCKDVAEVVWVSDSDGGGADAYGQMNIKGAL